MRVSKDKISVKQLLFVFTIIVSSPATRFLPKYSAVAAAQAGWLSPLISTIPFLMLIFIIDSLMKDHKDQSMADIICKVMGKPLGKLFVLVYLLWTVWLSALYLRYYTERLTSSIYTTLNNNVIIALTLIPIAYMLRSGFTVIARMSEVLLPFIGAMLVMLSIFLLPKVRLDNVLPVSVNDIVPMLKASLSSTSILAYLFLLFFLSDKLVNKKSFKTFGYIAAYVNISSIMLVNFICIGVLGYTITRRAPMPVLITVKQISLMDTIENIEAVIIAIWIFADFTLISSTFVVMLNLIKSLFKLSDTRFLINILAVLLYFLSQGISLTKFELEEFSNTLVIPINISLGYCFPLILLLVSKLRKAGKKALKKADPSSG